MNEYRVTRPDRYPEGVGHEDTYERQGYFVKARTLHGAELYARSIFPGDSRLDIELWRVIS